MSKGGVIALPHDAMSSATGRAVWRALAITVAVFAIYMPAWHGGFIWDDDAHLTRPDLRSWSGLGRIWAEPGATQQYYPVLHSVFWVQHRLFGDQPAGYHLVNLGLHSVNAVLVALLLLRCRMRGAWLAAGIFAVHPVMVESAAWISELKNTLSGAFYFGAALAYLRFDTERRARWYWLAMTLFVLALGSKTVTATLPGALLVVIWWQRAKLSWLRDVWPLVPFFAVGGVAGLFTAWVEVQLIGAVGTAYALDAIERVLLAGRIICFYIGKLAWPAELSFNYPRWIVSRAEPWQYLFPTVVIAVIAIAWLLRHRLRGPFAAALVFVGTLFPVLGFFNVYPFQFSYVADHFAYLASIGVIAPLAFALVWFAGRVGWRSTWAAGLALLVALSVMSHVQSRTYHNAETLYRATLERNPGCWMAHVNLGKVLFEAGRHAEAVESFSAAVLANSDDPQAHYGLGCALAVQGRTPEAVAEFEHALQLQPGYAKAHHNLGTAFEEMGRMKDAEKHFRAALRLMPEFSESRRSLAFVYLETGRDEEAARQFAELLRVKPRDPQAERWLHRLSQRDETER
jgi:tetratricopeptide (TPR) repeat protein